MCDSHPLSVFCELHYLSNGMICGDYQCMGKENNDNSALTFKHVVTVEM